MSNSAFLRFFQRNYTCMILSVSDTSPQQTSYTQVSVRTINLRAHGRISGIQGDMIWKIQVFLALTYHRTLQYRLDTLVFQSCQQALPSCHSWSCLVKGKDSPKRHSSLDKVLFSKGMAFSKMNKSTDSRVCNSMTSELY